MVSAEGNVLVYGLELSKDLDSLLQLLVLTRPYVGTLDLLKGELKVVRLAPALLKPLCKVLFLPCKCADLVIGLLAA